MKSFISFELYVRDVQEVTLFLENIFEAEQEYGDNNFAILWLEKTRIILNELKLDEFQPPNPILKDRALEHLGCGLEIVVTVDDLEGAFSRLTEAQAQSLTPITKQPWGLRDFRFLLSDGYYVRVTEPDAGVSKAW